ncbi:MAG: hypothetical protein EWV75_14735 [Microcystis wesenbergii Mw_QC_S_20081001_S30D]|uniref:Mobile element protein n=1 Tax=Microcystis wesenbergii Mw_QC_S_20081001_S30D TaxID=2486245 RepID=A0A552JGT7_9CHRO|nr:hypothetical protein [Microcystis aeruginosa W11-03]NCR92559.1 hypothetical protein [Microcystis aeruginosa W11-06]TRU94938.1 MAG: hypothetical protein EWV75_14735 [Microcystis wesenbergii Mw_QC_S_20081001_S30D]TRU97444.1 MAG: hypothetical protein EWV73_16815 [Microcystis wesenbergii Mw_QC_B_20070930_S4D]TRV02834.1 MAG: hypothetical protein EWV74_08175 [Microcystis wesenbergii Mw_QC_S_20081001_S30]TRV12343.1 MAG: hypothetical protein EWV89_13345 [Microcystis wesenbergii Mw_QC_B_20070930_S4]
MLKIVRNSRLKFGITSDFITQSQLLGGRTPQTPRWGRGAAPKPRSALVFRWDAYRQLLTHLSSFKSH